MVSSSILVNVDYLHQSVFYNKKYQYFFFYDLQFKSPFIIISHFLLKKKFYLLRFKFCMYASITHTYDNTVILLLITAFMGTFEVK